MVTFTTLVLDHVIGRESVKVCEEEVDGNVEVIVMSLMT